MIREGENMIYEERKLTLGEHEVILRSPTLDDAEILQSYIQKVTGETRFLLCEPDEIGITLEEELEFIEKHNSSEKGMIISAFVDGEFAGNCSFDGINVSRRNKHRADIGIALYQKFTGLGLGKLMMNALLEEIKSQGYEQAELTMISNNDRARHLYESFGFVECGRTPNANKYDDGTYSDDIRMVLQF